MSVALERAVVVDCHGESVVAVVHPAASAPARHGVLILVGGPQYRVGSHRGFVALARALASAGFPAMRFDFRGMGDSDGAARSFEAVGDDIRRAVDEFVAQVPGMDGVVLWGLCDAASAALMYRTDDPRIRGVVIVNPWVRSAATEASSYVRHYYGRRLLQAAFWRKVLRGEFDVTSSLHDFLHKLRRSRGAASEGSGTDASVPWFVRRMLAGLNAVRVPMLVLASERDLVAREFGDLCTRDPQWRRAVERAAPTWIDLAGADHTLSNGDSQERATSRFIEWLSSLERAACAR